MTISEDRVVARIPFLRAHADTVYVVSACVRWMVLFIIWGATAYQYKVFADLTPAGFLISCVFTLSSILVVLGFWTRLNMLAVACATLGHALLFHDGWSFMSAALAAGSAILPLGACYSVDRYLALKRPADEPFLPDASVATPPMALWQKLIVAFAVAVILGGPTYNQILHHNNMLFRSWDMFHKNAKDFVSVRFFTVSGGARQDIDYMTALGHKMRRHEVHQNRKRRNDMRIVGKSELDRVIRQLCGKVAKPADLRVEAKMVHLKSGWKVVYKGDEAVCTMPGGGA